MQVRSGHKGLRQGPFDDERGEERHCLQQSAPETWDHSQGQSGPLAFCEGKIVCKRGELCTVDIVDGAATRVGRARSAHTEIARGLRDREVLLTFPYPGLYPGPYPA